MKHPSAFIQSDILPLPVRLEYRNANEYTFSENKTFCLISRDLYPGSRSPLIFN